MKSLLVGDGTCNKVLQKGDIRGFFQWVEGEPALILTPARPKPGGGVFVLCESAVPRYVGSDLYLINKAREIALQLGMDDTTPTIHRIVDCLTLWIPDLLAMPPMPFELKRVVDEATIHVNGQEFHAERRE